MPLAEAQALVPELFVAPHDPTADRRALEKLAEACEQFTPWVALEEGGEPEGLLLDISNLEHLYGSEHELTAQIEKFFTRRGYQVRIAVAHTVGLAWALAHFASERASPSSGPATRSNSQFAICNLHFAISALPVEALRIAHDTAALLHQLGIQTVGQLQSLPREDLTSRFGDQLLRRLDQFTGAAEEPLQPHRELPALKAACTLDEPTADRAVLLHALARLVERLARQLAARDQGAVLLVCLLHSACGSKAWNNSVLGEGEAPAEPGRFRAVCSAGASPSQFLNSAASIPLHIGLMQPSANARQILELIELHLETLQLAGEIDRIELHASLTGRSGQRQHDLFADRWPTDPHQLALLVNRLSSRLGCEQVLRAELRPSPVPERAVHYVPTTQRKIDRETRRHGDNQKSRRSHSPCLPLSLSAGLLPPRPLLLHPQPQSMEVMCVAPDGPPQIVWLEGRREPIVQCIGPERIETLWWRGPSVRRDYYHVATQSGSHLWIFRRLTDARWFLHGVFE
jgi:protein ImuB